MTADTETIREADIEAIHRAIFHAPGDIHAAALVALGRVEERERALEQAVITLGRAAAFYADFEESGQSDWSMAMGACNQVYGRIPPIEGDDPDCYRFPAALAGSVAGEEQGRTYGSDPGRASAASTSRERQTERRAGE